jgi:hypothetical protein
MRKTRRALLRAIAEKIGGDQSDRLLAALNTKPPVDDTFDRLVSDEEFQLLVEKIGTDVSKAYTQISVWFTLDHLENLDREKRA